MEAEQQLHLLVILRYGIESLLLTFGASYLAHDFQ